jgi:hypothetical protein
MRRTVIGLSLAMAVVAAGCGSSAGTGGPAGTGGVPTASLSGLSNLPGGGSLDPCTLLTQDEVAAAVDHGVEAGVSDRAGSCLWDYSPGRTSLDIAQVGELFCSLGSNRSPLPGLPVPASWRLLMPGDTGSLVACKGDWRLQITMVGDVVTHVPGEATMQRQAMELMEIVLGRV